VTQRSAFVLRVKPERIVPLERVFEVSERMT